MITCYFGVPGVGKTSVLAKIGIKELRKIEKGKSKYKHVYTNFYLKGAEQIAFDDIKNYKLYDSLILFDEITMDADNRHFKSFPTEVRDFFILHRHLGLDIIYATQSYDMVDMKIKNLTADLWHMQKSVAPFFRNFTYARRVWRKVNINEHTAEMTNGYRYCNFTEAIFASNFRWSYRPLYYKYFDSFEEGVLAPRNIYYGKPWYNGPLDPKDPAISFNQLLSPIIRSAQNFKAKVLNFNLDPEAVDNFELTKRAE